MKTTNYDVVAGQFDKLRNQDIGVDEIVGIIKGNFTKPRVLDLGCGTGLPIGARVSAIAKKYFGVDNSPQMLKAFSKNIPKSECLLLDIVDIDKVYGEWDLIFGWGSVCHLELTNQEVLFQKIWSKLSNGGIFAFTSGETEGSCPGSVGDLSLMHYSMGSSQYKIIGKNIGLELISEKYCSGGFYLYQFKKSAQGN